MFEKKCENCLVVKTQADEQNKYFIAENKRNEEEIEFLKNNLAGGQKELIGRVMKLETALLQTAEKINKIAATKGNGIEQVQQAADILKKQSVNLKTQTDELLRVIDVEREEVKKVFVGATNENY